MFRSCASPPEGEIVFRFTLLNFNVISNPDECRDPAFVPAKYWRGKVTLGATERSEGDVDGRAATVDM